MELLNIKKIEYSGKESKNPLSFKYYNPEEEIFGTKMSEHLRFSVAFWHTFNANGTDMFGIGTMIRPWDKYTDPMDKAKVKIDALIEFTEKLGVKYFCFHDRDIAPEGKTLRETNKNLDLIVDYLKQRMKESGLKLLWGTANLFSNPRFVHGAATSCNADVFAYAAAQVKKAIEITKELDGENYVFWGGREGYETLLNTDMELELDNLARFLSLAVDYAKKIGFKGQFLIEPKPMEPTKHQYDFDSAHVLAFLRRYGLEKHFKLNIEANHATLAGHTFNHELRYARINGVLGSIDANQGDLFLGWDTDQFPTDIYATTLAMYEILKNGGLAPGGINFDAKVRRASFELEDLFIGHIAGMDTFALGLKAAAKLIEDGLIDEFIEERYSSYKEGIGKKIIDGDTTFEELEEYIIDKEEIQNKSGKQEYLEIIVNQAIISVI
ncbi:MAG: xylose isomerase [Thermotogaceae bacterium]|nr:xylose isomerase [Thermotogaceae bacterium]MDN5337248.1 xylose isomerase [Thermotogaceae bacterium]